MAVLSDIHGNLRALEAVVRDLRRRGVDRVVNLGDSVSGPLLPQETAEYLAAQDWLHIAGNHERQLLSGRSGEWGASDAFAHSELGVNELAWIASLEPTAALGAAAFLCHGTPSSDSVYLLETVVDGRVRGATLGKVAARVGAVEHSLVLCGHSHVPRAIRSSRGQLIVNPGSVGLPAYDSVDPAFHVVETGSPDARYAIVEQADGAWVALLVSVPYDHTSMARLAHERGREEWARALASGYVTAR